MAERLDRQLHDEREPASASITRNLAKTKSSIVFTVTSVTSSVGSYRAADNGDPDGDSTGTKITLHRP